VKGRLSVLRSLLITAPLIILLTILFSVTSLGVSLFDPHKRRQARLAGVWARVLLAVCGVKVQIEGLDKISQAGSYVFVSNHLSYMDTPAALATIPVHFRFLAKRGLFQIPFLGWHLKRAGHIQVPREDARAAVKTMNIAAQLMRQEGISLIIFPEGGRSRDGSLGEFKEGAALIAIRAGAPLVPVGLKGTREVLPFGSGHVQPGVVTLRIGDPIPTKGATQQDRERLTQQLRERVAALLDQEAIPA
jgi:1-acyl-sn-glycerol-3-phosphate acyltransferase